MINKINISILALLISITSFAQPHFGKEQGTLRFQNREIMVNPAYVGSIADAYTLLSFGAGWQWAGVEGAPKTQELQFQLGLPSAGVGAWLYHESYGVTDVIQFAGVYGYGFKLSEGHNISLGLNLSVLTVSEGFVKGIDDPNDPMFAQGSPRVWGFNSGVGAMYYSDKYYVGLSVPQLLTNSWVEGAETPKIENAFKFNQLQVNIVGGYVLELSDDINLIPNALLQFSGSTSFGYEFMLRGDYKRRVAVGVGYGYDRAIKAELNAFISKEVGVGYRYEQSFGSTYKHLSGSHSLILSIVWDRDKKTLRLF